MFNFWTGDNFELTNLLHRQALLFRSFPCDGLRDQLSQKFFEMNHQLLKYTKFFNKYYFYLFIK